MSTENMDQLDEQVETPQEPAQEVEQPEQPEQPQEPEQPEQEPEHKPGKNLQRRIDKLTRERYDAQREAAYWRGLAEGKQPPAPKEDAAIERPDPSQFTDQAQYFEALADWKADQKVRQALSEREKQEQQQSKQHQQAEAIATYQKRAQEFSQESPDFLDVIESADDVPMSDAMQELILGSEEGPRIAYYLAQNPDTAYRLSQMQPIQAAREFGRIEAQVTAKPAPAPKPSSAPKPITPTRGSGGQFTKDPDQMSDAEWYAFQRKA